MKKNYLYLFILVLVTIALTLLLSNLYKREIINEASYSYEKLNKITTAEFDEYMLEHPDTIIYISDKMDLDNNKFEKKLISKLEELNLLERTIYIEKEEITSSLKKKLEEKYSYKYNENILPVIIVINDNEIIQTSIVDESSIVDTIIDYEVFE